MILFFLFGIGAFICKMVPFVQCTAIVTEILTMTCIAVERHQGLVHPFKMKRQYTNQRAFTMLGMLIISCHGHKAPELRNLNKNRFIFADYFSLWSLGFVGSGPLCGEAEQGPYLMSDKRIESSGVGIMMSGDLCLPSKPTSQ